MMFVQFHIHTALTMMQILATCFLAVILVSPTKAQQISDLTEPRRIDAKILRSQDTGACPSAVDIATAKNELVENVTNIINEVYGGLCGGYGWKQVVFFDMTDTSYDCPPGLELTTFSKRTCGRPANRSPPGCFPTTFSVGGTSYSKVCGRIVAYTNSQTCAFYEYVSNRRNIDTYYIDGISLTHGNPGQREHIWSFASAVSEAYISRTDNHYCPCASSAPLNLPPNDFVGNDFFCESGRSTPYIDNYGLFYPNDPLWDGKDCTPQSTCCELNNPPWFTKELSSSTTDDIELRLCTRDGTGITPIELVELYVQ